MHPGAQTLRLACPSALLTTFRKAREKALVEFSNGAAKNQARQALLLWRQIAALALVVTIATPLMLAFSTPARAHCEVGNRIFTATITFDDPCVQDELALSTIGWVKEWG